MRLNRIALFLFIISSFVAATYDGGIHSHNFSVTTSPRAIIWALLIGLIGIFFPRIERNDVSRKPVGHWRRFVAVQIDFIVVGAFLIGLFIIPILGVEYLATGEWQWSYEREKGEFRDIMSILSILLIYYGLYHYFYKHAALNRPTAGQYIMGYRIIANGKGEPQYGYRVFHAAFNLWLAIFFIFGWSKIKDGNYQWDKATNTKAVRQV